MALPSAQLLVAHAVLQVPTPLPIDPARDDVFVAAVRDEFPNVTARQLPPAGALPTLPYLTLASTSSQLACSLVQTDFEVRFYGDLLEDVAQAMDYVATKVQAVRRGFEAIGSTPSMVGLIGTLHFSLTGSEIDPVDHILHTHLGVDVGTSEVQDAQAKVALRISDTYFVNLTINNYELKAFQRPIMPGVQFMQIRPWEGLVQDVGLELTVDINNNLEAQRLRANPEVTETGISEVVRLLDEISMNVGPAFAESGTITSDSLARSEA